MRGACWPLQRCNPPSLGYGVAGDSTIERFNKSSDFHCFHPTFFAVSEIMRFLAEIVIIGAVISLGWNTPFKQQVAQANAKIESTLHRTGSSLQKNQDPSVKRY
jgi:hypothetical protein